jgi:adenylosuccinate synthase
LSLVQWFDVDEVLVSCIRNGVDKLIINKLDVLDQVNKSWNVMAPGTSIDKVLNLGSKEKFKEFILEECYKTLPKMQVEFQESPL